MKKNTILILGLIGGVILFVVLLNPFKTKSSQTISGSNQLGLVVPVTPSKTYKTYTDPSGFSFSYPDNLSLLNNELKGDNSYAELQLTATGVEGSLTLKISDSKLASLDEWAKLNKDTTQFSKETKLGNLKASEITTKDEQSSSAPQSKLLLGALDQGVFFNIEIPLGKEKDFWMQVYNKVLADFSFAPPEAITSQGDVSSSSDVTLEGEEVVQ